MVSVVTIAGGGRICWGPLVQTFLTRIREIYTWAHAWHMVHHITSTRFFRSVDIALEQSSLFFPKSRGFKLGGDNVIFGMYGLNPGINCVGLGR